MNKLLFIIIILFLPLFTINACYASSSSFKRVGPTYSVHLMWINSERNEGQKYLSPNAEEFFRSIIGWAEKSAANTLIYVWYDSNFTTKEAIYRTEDLLSKELDPDVFERIQFRGLRSLELVKQNQGAFSQELPQTFRKALSPEVVVFEYARKEDAPDFIVYSDLDIKPLTKEQLLDAETIEKLRKYGRVMGENTMWVAPRKKYTNNFFIIDPKNESVRQATKVALIDLCIDFAKNYYLGTADPSGVPLIQSRAIERDPNLIGQWVYDSYDSMLKYQLYLSGQGRLVETDRNPESQEQRMQRFKSHKELFSDFMGLDRAELAYNFSTIEHCLVRGLCRIVYTPDELINGNESIKDVRARKSSWVGKK